MDFKEQVYNAFRQRIKSGQNVESACAFLDADFPGATKEQINNFCDDIYAKRYTRSFALTPKGANEALKTTD